MVSKKNKTSPPESRRARLYFFISNYSTTASSHLNTVMAMMMHMITGKTQWTRGMAGLECGARCLPEKREEMDK